MEAFQLWLRMMDDARYVGRLYASYAATVVVPQCVSSTVSPACLLRPRFGDVSAICAFRRVGYLPALLERQDLHSRLVYGSDYPVVRLIYVGPLVGHAACEND